MLGFISILLEVQVMGDIVLFIGRTKANGHVEFTPSFFLNSATGYTANTLATTVMSFAPM